MSDLPLTLLAETASTVTLGWTPVPCLGYVLYADGIRKSSSWDPAKSSWKTNKAGVIKVVALGAAAEGVYPSVVSPPPSPLHKHRLTVQPGGHDPDSGAGNQYAFCWGKFRSPTTLYVNDGNPRSIVWKPGGLYEARDLVVLWKFWPQTGVKPARILNFHTHPNFGGWSPDNSNGVSPLAFDWRAGSVYEGQSGLLLKLEAAGATGRKVWTVATDAEMAVLQQAGAPLDVRLDVTIGNPSGRVVCWVNGNLKFDTGVRPTCWPSQTAYSLWEGIYNSNGITTAESHTFQAARVGRTLAEAEADVPSEVTVFGSVFTDGSPAWSHDVVA